MVHTRLLGGRAWRSLCMHPSPTLTPLSLAMRSIATSHQAAAPEPVALACNVYVSEGKDDSVIAELKEVAASCPGALLAWTFVDRPYNRTGFTLTSRDPQKLSAAVVALGTAALQRLDLRNHSATHPRLGALDHISLHPLTPAQPAAAPATATATASPAAPGAAASTAGPSQPSIPSDPTKQQSKTHIQGQLDHGMDAAVSVAQSVAQQLSGPPWLLPVYLYGAAHAQGRRLADIRRDLGYFKPTTTPTSTHDGTIAPSTATPTPPSPSASSSTSHPANPNPNIWTGSLPLAPSLPLPVTPDCGPPHAQERWGVCTLGVRPWVANYNVPVRLAGGQAGADALLQAGRQVARLTSQRGGGLHAVEAMALLHQNETVEVACNLLDPNTSSPEHVQALVERLAEAHGLKAGQGYQTNLTAQQLIELTP